MNPKCVGNGCEIARLAERVTAVEEKLQRLEDLLVQADDDVDQDRGESFGGQHPFTVGIPCSVAIRLKAGQDRLPLHASRIDFFGRSKMIALI